MADDLGDDEWWLQGENVNISEDSASSEDTESPTVVKKRKTDTGKQDEMPIIQTIAEGNLTVPDKVTETCERPSDMLQKRKKRRKRITDELKEKPPQMVTANELLSLIRREYHGKLSPVEWDEVQLNTDAHIGTPNNDNLAPSSYLIQILPKWNKMVKKGDKHDLRPGCPLVLLVSSSAIRSVDLIRQVTDFRDGKGKLVKLFAKHAKLNAQQEFLQKTVVHLGIGTPNRITALIDNGCLHLTRASAVVLDWTWRNVKSKRLVDIPEIRQELLRLLKSHLIPHVRNNGCKLYMM